MILPPLDCHAHISVDVTGGQTSALSPAIVFAMTRDLDEAFEATKRYDKDILWGCGAHPSAVAKSADFDIARFKRRVKQFAIVGEVGLDRRSGNLDKQGQVLSAIFHAIEEEPVLVSIHSAGCSEEIVRTVRGVSNRTGLIMHWFTGTEIEVTELLELGCYFSVNSAMRQNLLKVIPIDRVLPETDFPVARKRTGARPGDTFEIERILAGLHHLETHQVRSHFYKNLRRVSLRSGAIDRMPEHFADLLLTAT